jgi:hypothetical protein
LDIILAYTGAPQHRSLFNGTNALKELMRLLPEPDRKQRVGVLKCLINFSQDRKFVEQLCELTFAGRIYDVLKENVKQDLGNT